MNVASNNAALFPVSDICRRHTIVLFPGDFWLERFPTKALYILA